jgi:UDP-N-acetylglucosamine acyltransferase
MNFIDNNINMDNLKIGKLNKISGNIILGKNINIGNNCIINGDITIGDNCTIGDGVILKNNIIIGINNHIGDNCSIGVKPTADKCFHKDNATKVIIGNNNIIEMNTIIYSNVDDNNFTTIGSDNTILANVIIQHDNKIGNNVTISDKCSISGYTTIFDNVVIGLGTTIHQYSTIGAFAMTGMGSIVTKDIFPFVIAIGSPIKYHTLNIIGLKRNDFFINIDEINNYFSNNTIGMNIEKYINEFNLSSRRKQLTISKGDLCE